MANPYTPSDGTPLSYWQQRIYDDARAREAAAQAAWSYSYPYCGTTAKQLNTTRTSGTTFSIDPELLFVPRPSTSYSVFGSLYFSGSPGSINSGITIGVSGTSTSSGSAYHILYFSIYTGGGVSMMYTGNPLTFSANVNTVSVNFNAIIDSTSDILSWADKDSPPYVGIWWKVGNILSNQTLMLKSGSRIFWTR